MPQEEPVLQAGDRFVDSCVTDCSGDYTFPAMRVLPAGRHLLGVPENPKGPMMIANALRSPSVSTAALAVSETEITRAQWDACFNDNICAQPRVAGCDAMRDDTLDMPIRCINLRDALSYVAWLSGKTGKPYRLLSEAEWEYAALAGGNDDFSWGAQTPEARANCSNCSTEWIGDVAPAGSFPPMDLACTTCTEMFGNWCATVLSPGWRWWQGWCPMAILSCRSLVAGTVNY